VDRLDKEIKEVKRLMLEAAKEALVKEIWDKRKPAKQSGQKMQKEKGADGQLKEKVWDLGGPQKQSRGNHKHELMIFPVMEYDAGA
jgi:hypothetical protein